MKNLKKVLALVMVFAMMATAMFSAAAFTDDADIVATDAVELLSTLGVINGFQDGSFQPNGTVTRAQMAAMLYIVRNGGKTNADGYKTAPTSFNDIKGHWAEGYIKHAQTMGLISGRSAKVFDPDATVTGVEAALMCLRTAGYDVAKAGIGGANWQATTMSLANEVGLIDDIQSSLFTALPRQWAAQMINNLLDVEWVVWSKDINDFKPGKTQTAIVGNSSSGYVTVNRDETVGEKYMGIAHAYGDLTKVELKSDGTYDLTVGGSKYTKVAKDFSNLYGAKVDVMMKDGKSDKVYGVKAAKDSQMDLDVKLYTVVAKDLDFDDNDAAKVTVNGKELNIKNTAVKALNDWANSTTTHADAKAMKTALTTGANETYNGSVVLTLIDNNNDDNVDVITYTPAKVGELTYVGSNAFTMGAIASSSDMKKDKYELFAGAKKEDFGMYVDNKYTVADKHIITKVDMVEGKIDATKTSDGLKQYKIGGTWYTEYKPALKDAELGDTAKFAVVNGVVFDVDTTASDVSMDNLIYVTKAAKGDSLHQGDVVFEFVNTKGETKTGKASKLEKNGSEVPSFKDTDVKAGLYTYTMDGADYELKLVDAKNKGNYEDPSNDVAQLKDKKFGKFYINDDAVFFVTTADNKTKLMTGAAVKGLGDVKTVTASTFLYKNTNGLSYVNVGAITTSDKDYDALSGGGSDLLFGYITSDVVDVKVGDHNAKQFTLWDGAAEKTVSVKNDQIKSGILGKGVFISFKNTADADVIGTVNAALAQNAEYTQANADALNVAQVVGFSAKDLVMENEHAATLKEITFKITGETKIIYVDTANTKGVPDGKIDLPQKDTSAPDTKAFPNVVFAAKDNADHDLKVVFVDVAGKLDGSTSFAF